MLRTPAVAAVLILGVSACGSSGTHTALVRPTVTVTATAAQAAPVAGPTVTATATVTVTATPAAAAATAPAGPPVPSLPQGAVSEATYPNLTGNDGGGQQFQLDGSAVDLAWACGGYDSGATFTILGRSGAAPGGQVQVAHYQIAGGSSQIVTPAVGSGYFLSWAIYGPQPCSVNIGLTN